MPIFNFNYFDRDFYRSFTNRKGAKRDRQSPHYIEFAAKVKECFHNTDVRTVLDIGCGMGWRTLNHLDNGFDATGVDVSRWAYNNSVLPPGKHICSDMRHLTGSYDLVIVERSIEYLPPKYIVSTLDVLSKLATKYIIFSVICSDHKNSKIVKNASPGRLTMVTKAEWQEWFSAHPWKLDEDKTAIMLGNDWDCQWVFSVNNPE